jgi:osmoprotectant transport system ATP-binding protein
MGDAEHDQPVIQFQKVSFRVGDGDGARELLRNLDLEVRKGETLVLLGRSGSGKTTTLKLINRLLEASDGDIRVNDRSLRDWDVIQLRRGIGYVIQEIGLFPHFTIARNIGLVPQIEHWPNERIQKRVSEMMGLVGLDPEIASRYPRELSGGQRQRVGVARALAADPPILLMDEPFGALDPITRAELQREFIDLQKCLQKTIVFVTHDLREALLLGTRIALIEAGFLVALLPPEEFVRSGDPMVSAYVEAFSANGNQQRGRS